INIRPSNVPDIYGKRNPNVNYRPLSDREDRILFEQDPKSWNRLHPNTPPPPSRNSTDGSTDGRDFLGGRVENPFPPLVRTPDGNLLPESLFGNTPSLTNDPRNRVPGIFDSLPGSNSGSATGGQVAMVPSEVLALSSRVIHTGEAVGSNSAPVDSVDVTTDQSVFDLGVSPFSDRAAYYVRNAGEETSGLGDRTRAFAASMPGADDQAASGVNSSHGFRF
ncbi:MAG: hypothetical protein ACRCYU_10345, partial [Nocardioides sp.]